MHPLGGGGGDQRLVRESEIEIVQDGEALREPMPVDLQHGHEALRIDRAIGFRLLLAFEQVDRPAFVLDALEVERNSHAIGGGRPIVIV